MSVELNHTIVPARDARASAEWLARVLGLEAGETTGHFVPVVLGNGVTLDFASVGEGREVPGIHYAFLVSEEEFDAIFGRVREEGITYYADPGGKRPGEINHNHGGRGVYFVGPEEGHYYEVITQPYA
jgi:catechol 2,3-dioxygenase-like lactoylglutathione lyase family enzyme